MRKTSKVKQFPFALISAKIDQNYVFFTIMFKILSYILFLGQVLSPGGFASDVFESHLSSHKPFESVVPNIVSALLLSGYLDLSIYLMKAVFSFHFSFLHSQTIPQL